MSADDPRILVVEDEPESRDLLRNCLTDNGYQLLEAETTQEAIAQAMTRLPDVVIIDFDLSAGDGQDLIQQIRQWSQLPIIVLSARGQESDKVQVLDLGADDYLTKPYVIGELLARVRVALRHAAQRKPGRSRATYSVGDLHVDLVQRRLYVAGREVHLSPTEFRVLATLVHHAGKVVTHRQLLSEVWGPDRAQETPYLRVYMAALRQKIEADSSQPSHILTEHGIGYRLKVYVKS